MPSLRDRLSGFLFLRKDLRAIRHEVAGLRASLDRIANAFELANAHHWPTVQPLPADDAAVEITYADSRAQQEFMDIELGLTQARGMPPTEDEIMAEFDRRRAQHG